MPGIFFSFPEGDIDLFFYLRFNIIDSFTFMCTMFLVLCFFQTISSQRSRSLFLRLNHVPTLATLRSGSVSLVEEEMLEAISII